LLAKGERFFAPFFRFQRKVKSKSCSKRLQKAIFQAGFRLLFDCSQIVATVGLFCKRLGASGGQSALPLNSSLIPPPAPSRPRLSVVFISFFPTASPQCFCI